MKYFAILLLSITMITVGCSQIIGTKDENCCKECRNAAQKDPSGYDIRIRPCSEYDLSRSCDTYFGDNNKTVGKCTYGDH